jgi:hypothetical protein
MAIQHSDFIKLDSFLDINNIHKDDICLVGSLSLAHIGIKDNNDIDLILRSDIRKEKFNQVSTIFFSNQIDIVQSPWSSIFSDDEIIKSTELHSKVNGYKLVIPELVYHKKKWLNRRKDQIDILEINEYIKVSPYWNWDIICDYLPKNRLYKRAYNSLKNRIRIFRDNLKNKINYSTNNHSDLIEVIPTNLLLSKQSRSDCFNRYDLMIRYMAIESFILDSNCEFKLYNFMQEKRGTSEFKDPEKVFKNLINSFKMIGFDLYSPIIVDKDMHVINGAHRLSCALFFGIKLVPISVFRGSFNASFGIEWFKKNSFSDTEINLLESKKEHIFLDNYMYFEIILWPPVLPFFNDIENDIQNEYRVLSSKTYNNFSDFGPFVRALYAIDDIKPWKVNLKLNAISKHTSSFRRITISVPNPDFRYKEPNKHLISQKIERLKKKIRNKYASKIDSYFHDIIIHIGDNFEHTRLIHDIAKDFRL